MKRNTAPPKGPTPSLAASAAAAAALGVLLTGERSLSVSVSLAPGAGDPSLPKRLSFPLGFCERILEDGAFLGYAGVIMPPGPARDKSSGILLTAHAARNPAHFPARFRADGRQAYVQEKGVTLYAGPGAAVLGLPEDAGFSAGETPPSAGQRQIAASLQETAAAWGYTGSIHCRLTALCGDFPESA